jgi:drug/metabolite transporter (DMT)-like permease
LAILGAAALFSTGGAGIKLATLSAWQVASFRSGVAAITVALLAPSSRRGFSRRTLLVSVAYAATLVLFVLANKLTTAASAIFLQAAAPLYILFLAPILLREPIRARDLVFMPLVLLGLLLFFVEPGPANATAPSPFHGNLLGGCAGLAWALTLVGLRWLGRDREGSSATGLAGVVQGNAVAFLGTLPFALPLVAIGAADAAILLYLGAIQVAAAYLLLTYGFREVPAFEASLLILLEPALSPLWAWLVHRETPSNWALAGGLLIVTATALKAWLDQGREPPRPRIEPAAESDGRG